MDLWDVAKLVVRRWLVSVPMLLLTAAAVAWTAASVSPNYTAESHILMLPPSTEVAQGEDDQRAVNPWDTDSLTGAVVTLLRDNSLEAQLAAEGYAGTWEASRDPQFWSVINIEVTAPSPEEGEALAERLTQVVTQEVSTRQQGYGLVPGQLVGTVALGEGQNVEISRSNQLRAIIVVLAAGGILTVGITVAFDAVLRARANKRAARAAVHPAIARADAPDTTRAPAGSVPLLAAGTALPGNGAHAGTVYAAATGNGVEAAQHLAAPGHPGGISVSYRGSSEVQATDASNAAAAGRNGSNGGGPKPSLEDATIVLPLTNLTPVAAHDDEADDHGEDHDDAEEVAESRWR